MGLLDDAIREHLDLKRRRGADPTEVERAEREALGPVRRAPESVEEVEPNHNEPSDAGVAYDHEDEHGWGNEPVEEEAPAPERGPLRFLRRSKPAPEPELSDEGFLAPEAEDSEVFPAAPDLPPATSSYPAAAAEPRPSEPPRGTAPADAAPAEAASEPYPDTPEPHPAMPEPRRPTSEPSPAAPEPGHAGEHGGDETMEYDVEDALGATEEKAGEDVLEETPEFLQDTPEHDRLWFEQRPPRDFDFDG